MPDIDLADADLTLFGNAAISALQQAVEAKSLTAEQLQGLYGFLLTEGIVRLVGGGQDGMRETVEGEGSPATQGGDGEAVSPAANPSPPPKPGTPANPIAAATADDVDKAARRIDRRPSKAKAAAGNYRKAHVLVAGLNVSIETAKGGVRRGRGADGKAWQVKMPVHYGGIKRTTGADDDQVDVFIGPHVESDRAFVIDQVDPDTGAFDELKTVLGARTKNEALRFYTASFSDGKGRKRIGGVKEMSTAAFRDFLKNGGGAKPVAS